MILTIGCGADATQTNTEPQGQRGNDSLIADGPDPSGNGDTRSVGIGSAYVAVPSDWGSNQASCNTPIRDTYYFPHPQDCAAGVNPRVPSVAIATGAFPEAGIRLDRLRPAGELDGHEVLETSATCELSDPGACTQTFAVPDLDAYFHVTAWSDDGGSEVVRTIRESLTLLDDGETIVPFTPQPRERRLLDPHGTETEVVTAIKAAGLSVEIERTTCPDTANCMVGVTGIEPAVGTVVPTGSKVTVTVIG